MTILAIIIAAVVYITITVRVKNKWGFAGTVWSDRMCLMIAILPAAVDGHAIMMWVFGVPLILNMVFYNPWSLPTILETVKNMEDEDKSE